MNLDLVEITTYLTVGLVLYYFLIELTKPRKGAQKWVTLAFAGAILLLVAYLFWTNWKKSEQKNSPASKKFLEEEEDESGDNISEDDSGIDFSQGIYIPEKKDFSLINGTSSETNQITYADFKVWYLTPEFLTKFTDGIRKALQIKRRRLREVRQRYLADLEAVSRQNGSQEGLNLILNNLYKNDDAKMLESTITEINALLEEIKRKERTLSIESTRKGLISALTDRNNGIDSLTGRDEVKDFLALQLYTFSQNPRVFFSNFQNMAIYGPSGSGKTKLAQTIGHVYAHSGVLLRNHVHIITKQSMTTAYVNESARMTRKLLLANLESVVFIDEAYDITPPPTILGNGIDHGHEAITELVNFADKMKGLSLLIVAGYEKEMEKRFMKANEGLPRRFPHKVVLKPYSSKELTDILIRFILTTCPELKLTEKEGNYLYTIISYINKKHPEMFERQAGDMENLSGFIARSIYGTLNKNWAEDSKDIILTGVNAFLSTKGMTLEEL